MINGDVESSILNEENAKKMDQKGRAYHAPLSGPFSRIHTVFHTFEQQGDRSLFVRYACVRSCNPLYVRTT